MIHRDSVPLIFRKPFLSIRSTNEEGLNLKFRSYLTFQKAFSIQKSYIWPSLCGYNFSYLQHTWVNTRAKNKHRPTFLRSSEFYKHESKCILFCREALFVLFVTIRDYSYHSLFATRVFQTPGREVQIWIRSSPGQGFALCSLARDLTLIMLLSIQVYKYEYLMR